MKRRFVVKFLISGPHHLALVILGLMLSALLPVGAGAQTIQAVSNRADLVSGGDVLLRTNALGTLSLNGNPLVNPLHPAPDGNGFLALVTGLQIGLNSVSLSTAGGMASLSVTNHSLSGPIFSGPPLQPWTCTTQTNGLGMPLDADCNAPTQYTYSYRTAGTGVFAAYDPGSPPPAAEIAMTTTDKGATVPYIVRTETGTLNRSIYRIAVLFDPAQPWSPWAPQPGWNGKLLYLFGAGCGSQYTQGTNAAASVLDHNSLSRGFATATATLTNEGTVCNSKLNAETLMMVKERLAEGYGPIRYTMGSGCSGGAIQQHSIGDQYPGLVDGFLPVCSYPDIWSLYVNSHDCHVLTRYFTTISPALWANPLDRQAVLGQPSEQECPGQDGPAAFGGRFFPVTNTSCLLPASALYDPVTNPTGVRCSLKDYHIAVLGTRPDGFAYQVTDSVGVQYGLQAFQAGRISAEQFVDLNEKIGGLDIAGNYQAQRTVADMTGLERMYRAGLITYGRELGKYPIIDARTDDNHEMHNNSEWMFTRYRLLRTNGNAANQIHWWENAQVPLVGNISRPSPANALRSFDLMDQWLAAIEADTSAAPHETKVTLNKPAAARDTCFINGQEFAWTPGSVCDSQFTFSGLVRMTAGGPNTNDVLKCQLKPINWNDYSRNHEFTGPQWMRLKSFFRGGVCDYSKPGVAQQAPIAPWLTFAGGPGGVPLGPPPVSQ